MTDYRTSHVGADRGRVYDERYARGAEEFYWSLFEKPYLERLFARLATEHGTRYLDFATGTGRILETAAQTFSDVTGLDVSEDMLQEAARKVSTAKLLQADITKDTVNLGTFDVITCFRFILNAQPELRICVLQWLRQVIDDDGVLVINNHLNRWSLTGIVCGLSNLIRGERRHNLLSDREVRELIAGCGFAVTEQYGFGIIPAWRNRLLLPRALVLTVERVSSKTPLLGLFAKDRVYLCRPV